MEAEQQKPAEENTVKNGGEEKMEKENGAEMYNPFEDTTEETNVNNENNNLEKHKNDINKSDMSPYKQDAELKTTETISTEEEKTEADAEPIHFEDDGEDLPDNFFDDFSNTDFMAGLDIVDDMMDDEEPEKNDYNSKKERLDKKKREHGRSDKRSPNRDRGRSPHHRGERSKYVEIDYKYKSSRYSREKHLRSRYRERYSRERYVRGRYSREPDRSQRNKSRDRGRSKEYKRLRDKRSAHRNRSREHEKRKSREGEKLKNELKLEESKSDSTSKPEEIADSRRDPEKTRRDIQKDKLRHAKDQEARVFQEQLKVAETGLVPPGTELEVVLECEKLKKEKHDKEKEKKSHTPKRNTSKSNHVERSRLEHPRKKSQSPRQRSLNRDRVIHQEDDLRFHLREKRRRRHLPDLSPVSETRLSRSPLSDISTPSERETWLRNRDKRRRRSKRSCSPISSNSLSDDGFGKRRRSKRMPFKEKIEQNLSATSSNQFYPPSLFSNIINVPPAPIASVQPQNPVYMPAPVEIPYQPNPNMYMGQDICQPTYEMPMQMHPDPVYHFNQIQVLNEAVPMDMAQNMAPQEPVEQNSTRVHNNLITINKLFEDKKISLSDYLSASAKPTIDSVSTHNIHNKIKVIARCQEAISNLKENSKVSGRFFPKLPAEDSAEAQAEQNISKWKSPLRKCNPIRIRSAFGTDNPTRCYLYKLLCSVGLGMPVKQAVKKTESVPVSSPAEPVKPAPVKTCTVPTQTDPYKCLVCQSRSEISVADASSQTKEKLTYEMSTQVSTEELTKAYSTYTPRGILKGSSSPVQSILHLTPAQLLAQMEPKKDESSNIWRADVFGPRHSSDRFAPSVAQSSSRPLFSNSDQGGGMDSMSNYKSIFGGNFGKTSSSFKGSFPEKSFAFSRGTPDMGPQWNEFHNRPSGNNSNRFDTSFQNDDFFWDSHLMEGGPSFFNRSGSGRGRGGMASRAPGNVFPNRPFFN